jgi:hypothetical protein
MLPIDRIPEEVRTLREQAAKDRRASSHHPGDGFRTFPALPKDLSDPVKFEALVKKVNDCEFDEQIIALI